MKWSGREGSNLRPQRPNFADVEQLETWLKQEHAMASLVEQVPDEIKTFTESFQAMNVRQQKAQLQTIIKAAKVFRDGRIELEFRESQIDK